MAATALPLGEVFAGRYLVEKLLGRGGMGLVYRAHDRLVNEHVALKLLHVEGATPDAVDMLRREARVARRVTHPNVVRVHDLDQHDGRLFITMQHVDGTDLRHAIGRDPRPLAPLRAARVALDVALGLAAAHAMNVMHRDIKPENVLIDMTGRSLLSDFGIARVFGREAPTAQGEDWGTPAYMSPEQVRCEESGPATDIYALGVLLYEMLVGEPPFVADDPVATAIARLAQPAPALPASGPDGFQPALVSLVAQCLQLRPEDRPPSATHVAEELRSFLGPNVDGAATQGLLLARATAKTARARTALRPLPVPFGSGRTALACLPFACRGSPDHDYLGDALSAELAALLNRTRGLRVMSGAALGGAGANDRDPGAVSAALGVDYVTTGTVQLAGSRVRITIRLADAAGTQLFVERFDLGLGEVLEMPRVAAQRIAEALRLEIVARSALEPVPDEPMQLYLGARRLLRPPRTLDAREAVTMLERALAQAPAFTPALAALAIATVNVWFYPQGDATRDWEQAAASAVSRALAEAADLPETHVAEARLASHRGRLREAVEALRRAIDIAPTSPDAHQLLGQLECETGHADEGLARLSMARQLEPGAGTYEYEAARLAGLRGDHAMFHSLQEPIRALHPTLARLHLQLRYAAWWRDHARLEAIIAEAPVLGAPFAAVFITVASCHLGRTDPSCADAALAPIISRVNPRFAGLLRQVLVEVHARAGDLQGALSWLSEARASVLYDVPWLELCPLLAPLRSLPAFAAIVHEVRATHRAIWAV